MEIVGTILAITAQLKLQIFQFDVKLAFLDAELEKVIYLEEP